MSHEWFASGVQNLPEFLPRVSSQRDPIALRDEPSVNEELFAIADIQRPLVGLDRGQWRKDEGENKYQDAAARSANFTHG
jgi:hypothetical protein